MKRYEVTFCAPADDNERKFIARAVLGADDSSEAAQIAYNLLKPTYPEIHPGEWMAIHSDKAMLIPDSPVELPFDEPGDD